MNRLLLGNWRFPLVVSFLSVAGIFLAGNATGRVYPVALAMFFVGMAVLAVLAIHGGSFGSTVGGGVVLASAFRLHTNYITTPVGSSPQMQPARIDRIFETGVIRTGSSFYDDAPLHFLLSGTYSTIAGVSAYDGIMLYSLLISIVLALVAIGLLRYLDVTDRRVLAAVALLALVTTEGLRRSYWVVPQVTATILFWCTILAVTSYVMKPSRSMYVALAVFSAALAFTHKLPIVFLAVMSLGYLCLLSFDLLALDSMAEFGPVRRASSLTVLFSAFTGIQIAVTGILYILVRRSNRILDAYFAEDTSSIRGGVNPEGAVQALPGVVANYYEYPSEYVLFVERGHGVWLLLAACIAWAALYLFARKEPYRPRLLTLLGVSAIGVLMMIGGIVAISGMNPTRPLFLIEPVLVVLIVAATWKFASRITGKSVLTAVIVVLLATQIFAASAAPDYANTPRYYADVPEAQAEATFCEYASGDVYVDAYYGRFVDSEKNRCSNFRSFGTENDNDLFDRNVTMERHETVAFRNDVDVYLGEYDRWRLTWDPSEELPEEYHTVFDNGAVTIYESPE